MKDSFAEYLVKKTEDDYNKISSLFSNKRSYITPDLEELGDYAKEGDRVLDFGCGNGRFFEVLKPKKVDYLGVDASEELISIAKQKYLDTKFQKVTGNPNLKKFSDSNFDVIFCLAVLHHIPSEKLRKTLLDEFSRILKSGGLLIITVWDLRQKSEVRGKILINDIKRSLGLSKYDHGDVLIPFKDKNQKNLADRYLHVFTQEELSNLLNKSKFKVKSITRNNRGKRVVNKNIVAVAKKN